MTRAPLSVALAAYRRFVDLATGFGPADPDRPTRLAGWRVGDLVDHVAWGMSMEADALRRATMTDPVAADGLVAGLDAFAVAIEGLDDPELLVPLPTGTVPLAFAAPLFALEAAVHASDLADALGVDAGLDADELAAALPAVTGALGFLGALGERPDAPVRLALRGGTLGWDLVWDGEWGVTEECGDTRPGDHDAVVTGPDEEVFLCVLGRTPVRSLRIAGDADLAGRLKAWFPGP